MQSIKQIFSPSPDQTDAPGAPASSQPQPISTPPVNSLPGPKNKSKTPLFLSAILLVLMVVGGAVAYYLTGLSQDTRQQASGIPGLYANCSGFASEGSYYCGSTAPGTCLQCNDGIGQSAPDDKCMGKPCGPDSIFNNPTCNGEPVGSFACAGLGEGDCKKCVQFTPCTGCSPQAKWEATAIGNCAGLACGAPLPTPISGGQCPAGIENGATCSNITGQLGCSGYQTCHTGSGYTACEPNGATNQCTYTLANGSTCTAQCPGSVSGTGLSRCECSNGVWTIGKLPPGGSCAQLCACTGNDCPTCNPTKPPGQPTPTTPTTLTTPTPTPTRVPTISPTPVAAQCTNIKMLNADGSELTEDDDDSFVPGSTAVKFSCAANGTVAKYEFRVILPDGSIQTGETTSSLLAVGSITGNYVIPAAGKFTAQCRICTAVTGQTEPACQEWEPVGTPTTAPTAIPTTTN